MILVIIMQSNETNKKQKLIPSVPKTFGNH